MKSNFCATIITALLIGTSSFAQQTVKIKGNVHHPLRKEVKLFQVSKGNIEEIASSPINADKSFDLAFYPKYEGLYVIGTGSDATQQEKYWLYFKGGEQVDINLLDSSYTLNGKENSKENEILQQWHKFVNPLYQRAISFKERSTFKEYFELQDQIVAKSKTFLNGKATGNKRFDQLIKDIIELDFANYATNFVNSTRSTRPSRERRPSADQLSDFYTTLKAEELAKYTHKIYNYPYGLKVLSAVAKLNMQQDKAAGKPEVKGLAIYATYVPNDTLKGDLILEKIAKYETFKSYNDAAEQYGKYFLTKEQKEKNSALAASLSIYRPGADGYQFAYADQNGKTVSFESLKGKVVLVDVWATWCSPCRGQFPYLKELEKDIEGKPIQIVGITIDAEKDKEKWRKMIKDEKLGGIQLFAGQSNKFSDYYKISAIPRFLVFNKEGKIVNVDAPRPSDPKLKALLFAEAAK